MQSIMVEFQVLEAMGWGLLIASWWTKRHTHREMRDEEENRAIFTKSCSPAASNPLPPDRCHLLKVP